MFVRMTADGKASSEAAAKDLLPSAYPLSHKIRYPSHLTSTAFYFLYYFLILVFVFRFTLPGKYENRTHHGNHLFLYCFHY